MQHNVKPNRSRRRFLLGASALSITAGTVGSGVFFNSIGKGPDFSSDVYAPWTEIAQGTRSDAEYMILCAHLAASPHNTQPWIFHIYDDHIEIISDMKRNIGAADPENRQLHQGIGCALENLVTAATALGYRTEISHNVDAASDGGVNVMIALFADETLQKDNALITAIFNRATNRGKYDPNVPVPPDLRAAVTSNIPDGIEVKLVDAGTKDAVYITSTMRMAARELVRDNAFYVDSMGWWRPDRASLEQHGDGISILTADLSPTVKGGMAAVVTDTMWMGEFGKRGEIGSVDAVVESTPVWGVIAAQDRSISARIDAGRVLQRTYLQATMAGFHVHPLNYAVEHPQLARKLKSRLGLEEGAEMLTIFRLGLGPDTEKSPRRPLSHIII